MSIVSDEPMNTFTEKWPNYSLFKQTIIYYVKSELWRKNIIYQSVRIKLMNKT